MKDIIFNPIIPFIPMLIISIVLILIVIINQRHILNRLIIIILLFIISQRPMIPGEEETFKYDLDVIFAIDNTLSMNAIDVNNNTRLKAVINDCKYIIEKLGNSDYSIITFNNFSQIRVPFTSDIDIIEGVLDNLYAIDPIYASGSSLSLPLNNIKKTLNTSKEKNEHKRVVFFISDGEINNSNDNTSLNKYSELKDLIDEGAVLGYGTTNGAKIVVNNTMNINTYVDGSGFLLDKSNNTHAISKLNETTLKEIAKNMGLDYYHMINKEVLNGKIASIKKMAQKSSGEIAYANSDLYYYLSFVLTILLILELLYNRRNAQ